MPTPDTPPFRKPILLEEMTDLPDLLARAHDVAMREARARLGVMALAGATASDVAQSVVQQIIGEAGSLRFHDMPAFVALVRKLALRHVVKKLRHARAARRDVRRSATVTTELAEDMAAVAPTPQLQAQASEWQARLEAALAGLGSAARNVLRLRMAGCTHAEIAAQLGISEANSTKLLTRARDGLTHLMDGPTP